MRTIKLRSLFHAILILLLFQTGTSIASETERQRGPIVHNLASAFLQLWETIESKSVDEQVVAVKENFLPQFPEFYEYKIKNWKKPKEELKKEITKFPKIKNEFAEKTRQITINLDSALQTFVAAFPDMHRNFEVYITHSFGEMDGGSRTIDGTDYFILGIDGMVQYHKGFDSEIPFFHHELFHVYHSQHMKEEKALWAALWAEGLATYVSKKLNPESTLKDLMLDLPEGMVREIENDIDFYWKDLRKKLRSTAEGDYREYFLLSSQKGRITIRSGYYLGYLLAKEVAKTKTLSEMAKMKPKSILPMLERKIDALAKENAVGRDA